MMASDATKISPRFRRKSFLKDSRRRLDIGLSRRCGTVDRPPAGLHYGFNGLK